MATAFDNTKYDVQLNEVPYRVRGYQRSELSTFIPRFGAGEQSESQFDLLRSATINRFAGGELQRYWLDESSVYGIEGLENKYDDGVLYPTNTMTTDNGVIYGTVKPKMTAWTTNKDYLFVASTTYNTPTTSIKRIDKSGTVTTCTLPTNLSNNRVTSLVVTADRVWAFCAYHTGGIFYMNLSGTTFTEVTGGSGYVTKAVYYRGDIYGTSGLEQNRNLYQYTGNTTTRSWELVGRTEKNNDTTANLFVYNNRIFLTRKDGMYAYDGVLMNVVEDMQQAESTQNYKCPAVLKGYLYYFMPDGMYRFNGSLIEKLFDVSESGVPEGVVYGNNRLWYVYRNSEYAGSTRYDKSMGYDYETGDNVQGRVSYFDGNGMFTQSRLSTFDKGTITEDFSGQGEPDNIIYFNGDIYVTTDYSKFGDNLHIMTDPPATTRAIVITTSIFDGGFPQVFKQLEETEIALDGNTGFAHTITVEARTETTVGGFEGDGGWVTVGTCTVSGNKIMPVYDQSILKLRFKKIQFRITGTLSPETGIEKFIVRFTLQPDYKNQWTFTALCYGDDNYGKLQLADNSEEATYDADALRGNIYNARESDYPIGFVDIDYFTCVAMDASQTTIYISSDDILKADEGFIQIDTEIMKYERDTQTSLVVTRGVLGTTATTHATNAVAYPYYRVVVRQIQNERVELSDDEQYGALRKRDSEITLVLQEV